MSTEYTRFQNETGANVGGTAPAYVPPQPGEQGYGPPLQYPVCPPGNIVQMTQVVAPTSQTIISTATTACQPRDYFGLAIFVMICCCLPLGIVGLVKSNDVRNRFLVGDYVGAELASKEAKTYTFVGLGIGIGVHTAWIVTLVVCLATAAA